MCTWCSGKPRSTSGPFHNRPKRGTCILIFLFCAVLADLEALHTLYICLQLREGAVCHLPLATGCTRQKQPYDSIVCCIAFRVTYEYNPENYIIHTMMTEWPQAEQPPPTAISDNHLWATQIPLESLPSPTRGPSFSSQTPIQQPDFSSGHSQHLSDLTVGPSNTSATEPPLLVKGNAKITGTLTTGSIRVMSDKSLKHNINPLDVNGLAKIDKIQLASFQWRNDPSGQSTIGVLAQQLQEVLPEAVEVDKATSLLSVKLDTLVMYTLKGVQEAHALLKELNDRQPLGMSLLMNAQQQDAQQSKSAQGLFPNLDNPWGFANDSGNEIDSMSEADTEMSLCDPTLTATSAQSVEASSSAPSPAASFSSDSAIIKHILSKLGESNPGMRAIVLRLLKQLGKDATWRTFLDLQNTRLLQQDGTPRSPGSTFLHLMKKRAQDAKLR